MKLTLQKIQGQVRDREKLHSVIDAELDSQKNGCIELTIKRARRAKTNPQLGYYWGGVIGEDKPNDNGMVKQMLDRGYDTLGCKDYNGEQIPIKTNKTNCDLCLKEYYMLSIGRPLEPFHISESDIENFSHYIDWCVDYLARERHIYIMSSEEYKRIHGPFERND